MRSQGWGPKPLQLVPSYQEGGTQGRVCVEERPCEDMGRRQPPAAKESGLGRNRARQQLGLGVLATRPVRNKCLLFEPPRLWCGYSSRSGLVSYVYGFCGSGIHEWFSWVDWGRSPRGWLLCCVWRLWSPAPNTESAVKCIPFASVILCLPDFLPAFLAMQNPSPLSPNVHVSLAFFCLPHVSLYYFVCTHTINTASLMIFKG